MEQEEKHSGQSERLSTTDANSIPHTHRDNNTKATEGKAYDDARPASEPQEETVDHDHKGRTLSSRSRFTLSRVRKAESWRQCVFWSSLLSLAILILNLVITIWATTRYGTKDGVGVGYEGSCEVVGIWSTGLKIAINILSSALLGVSNYSMQCLSAPTRRDLDQAHQAGDWMDVGVSGFRNLFRIRKFRVLLWASLAISSVPIHLFYNSTIFKTLSANEYTVVVANDDFLTHQAFVPRYWVTDPSKSYSHEEAMTDQQVEQVRNIHQRFLSNSTTFDRLDNNECIDTYYTDTVAGHSNVILVADYVPQNKNDTVLYLDAVNYTDKNALAYAWICHDTDNTTNGLNPVICDAPLVQQHAANWTINGRHIQHCFAEVAPSFCKLQFCTPMLIAVIVCNAIKCVAMLLAVWSHKDSILVTTGDAVSSYLDSPDDSTKGRCFTGIDEIRQDPYPWSFLFKQPRWDASPPTPKEARPHNRRWFAGASKKRWYSTCIFVLSCCAVVGVFLGIGVTGLAERTGNSDAPWTIGFGAINTQALIGASLPEHGSSRVVSAVILANLPQMLLSFIYLGYNGLFTCMLLAREWNLFSHRRRVLRVSSPKGAQKSSRFLTLPYRYGIPLLIGSTVMHWLISESIYLVHIVVYRGSNEVSSNNVFNLGYSPKAMATVIGLAVYAILLALAMGLKKLDGFMPVAGSCSVAIAAACHPPKNETDAALFPLMWGESPEQDEGTAGIGHCTFSSQEVRPVTACKLYAG